MRVGRSQPDSPLWLIADNIKENAEATKKNNDLLEQLVAATEEQNRILLRGDGQINFKEIK